MKVEISVKEHAQNVAFQVKQLMANLDQLKPQIEIALEALRNGVNGPNGIPADLIEQAIGKAEKDEMVKQLQNILLALN